MPADSALDSSAHTNMHPADPLSHLATKEPLVARREHQRSRGFVGRVGGGEEAEVREGEKGGKIGIVGDKVGS